MGAGALLCTQSARPAASDEHDHADTSVPRRQAGAPAALDRTRPTRTATPVWLLTEPAYADTGAATLRSLIHAADPAVWVLGGLQGPRYTPLDYRYPARYRHRHRVDHAEVAQAPVFDLILIARQGMRPGYIHRGITP
jgi:hypothetical protein